MSAVKERIWGAVTVMNEEDALKIWDIIRFQLGFPIAVPTDEEAKILDAYHNGEEKYSPFLSHEDLKKELSLA